jgi:hypothetical protein
MNAPPAGNTNAAKWQIAPAFAAHNNLYLSCYQLQGIPTYLSESSCILGNKTSAMGGVYYRGCCLLGTMGPTERCQDSRISEIDYTAGTPVE